MAIQTKEPVVKELKGGIFVKFHPNGDAECVNCKKRQNDLCPLTCSIILNTVVNKTCGGK